MRAELAQTWSDLIRPGEQISPSEWAERHRRLKPGTTARPGPWRNDVFPYLTGIMDAAQDVLSSPLRGLVCMKSGQGGGSEAFGGNVLGWIKSSTSGNVLYLISKDDVAREFSRDRLGYMCQTAKPLAKKHLAGRTNGELLQVKRFTDGKIQIQGGQSVLNLQSEPYVVVLIDEIDSLQVELPGEGDLIRIAEVRLAAHPDPDETGVIAWAHPTERTRGAGRLYYDLSDQRRGYVGCAHCDGSFWLQWGHVQALPEGEETSEDAAHIPARYRYWAPCCGAEITDADRAGMVRAGVEQRSTLPPEVAATKTWRGVHFSALYVPHMSLLRLAEEYVEGLDKPSSMRVWRNKRMGDIYEPQLGETTVAQWRACVYLPRGPHDQISYRRGQVPGWVSYLTAGQDSGATELHWAVWGWGLIRDEGGRAQFCGALVDYGIAARPRSMSISVDDLAVFDGLLYQAVWRGVQGRREHRVRLGLHDCGWSPVGVYEYCRTRKPRALPCRGAKVDSTSRQPFLRWLGAPKYQLDGQLVDPDVRVADINTHLVKEDLFGMIPRRFAGSDGYPLPRIMLPVDVDQEYLEQSSTEHMVERKGKTYWLSRGHSNHYSDCNVYAYTAGINLRPFLEDLTQVEADMAAQRARQSVAHTPRRPVSPIRTRY